MFDAMFRIAKFILYFLVIGFLIYSFMSLINPTTAQAKLYTYCLEYTGTTIFNGECRSYSAVTLALYPAEVRACYGATVHQELRSFYQCLERAGVTP